PPPEAIGVRAHPQMGIVARPTPALLRQPGGMKLSHRFVLWKCIQPVTSRACAMGAACTHIGTASAHTALVRTRAALDACTSFVRANFSSANAQTLRRRARASRMEDRQIEIVRRCNWSGK